MCQRISDSNQGAVVLHIISIECNFTFAYKTTNILRTFSMIRKDENAGIETQRIN